MIGPSQRALGLPAYAVGAIAERKRQLLAEGVDVIDLGAGEPNVDPPPEAVEGLRRALADPAMSRYGFQQGLPAFRTAIARFMDARFGVPVDPGTEVLPLIGSKEGLSHLPLAVLDPGSACLVPEPGYPAYRGGLMLAGVTVELFPLREEGGFLLELDTLPPDRLDRIGLVYLNYPHNPTGAVAPPGYLERVVAVCRRHHIVLAYDNPYSEITYDGYRAPSVLEVEGARHVAIEFHSFSKSFGMTGWRLGWAVGNTELIKALSKVKSYVDTGPFLAVQQAGADVLDRAEAIVAPIRARFQARRDALLSALAASGHPCPAPGGAMYLWMRLPEGLESAGFARNLLDTEGLAVLPGSALGQSGEGYVRLSFVAEPERLQEVAVRLGRALSREAVSGPHV